VDGDLTVWARHLTGGDVAVALYNEGDAAASVGFGFAAIGWGAGDSATVRDLWAHSDLGVSVGAFANTTVEAHGTVVLRLKKSGE
jgi:alpha-galactosidase